MPKTHTKKRNKNKSHKINKRLQRQRAVLLAVFALLITLLTLQLTKNDPITVVCDRSDPNNLMGFSSRKIGSNGQSYVNQDWSIQLNCDRSYIFADERWDSNMPYYESTASQKQFDNFLRLYQKYKTVESNLSCTQSNDSNGKVMEFHGQLGNIHIDREWEDCPSNPEKIPRLYTDIEKAYKDLVPDFPY